MEILNAMKNKHTFSMIFNEPYLQLFLQTLVRRIFKLFPMKFHHCSYMYVNICMNRSSIKKKIKKEKQQKLLRRLESTTFKEMSAK